MTDQTIALWEKPLLGLPLTPGEQAELDRQHAQAHAAAAARRAATAERRAAQARAWPALHTPGQDVIDLHTQVWPRLGELPARLAPLQLVQALADQAGGLAIRLQAGAQSLLRRRDRHVQVHLAHLTRGPGTFTVTAWSLSGNWTRCAWWLTATFRTARRDGTTRLIPLGEVTLAVRSRSGATIFRDSPAGPLPQLIAGWYRGWQRRQRHRAGLSTPPRLVTCEEVMHAQPHT